MQFRNEGPSSMLDRFVGAIIALVFCAFTSVALPLFVVFFAASTPAQLFGSLFHVYSSPLLYVWVAALSISACVLGAIQGSARAIEFLGHLWGTEKPQDQEFTQRIWIIVCVSGCITFWLVYPWGG